MLSFLEGHVPPNWQLFADAQVRQAGRLLRDFHDSTRGSSMAGDHPVVCHNDPGPNNVVFDGGVPYALIDFDMVAPGDPVLDLGYMAWSWCVSSQPGRDLHVQAAQVRILADGYGLGARERHRLHAAIVQRQRDNIPFWEAQKAAYDPTTSVLEPERIDRVIAWTRREIAFTTVNTAVFELALR